MAHSYNPSTQKCVLLVIWTFELHCAEWWECRVWPKETESHSCVKRGSVLPVTHLRSDQVSRITCAHKTKKKKELPNKTKESLSSCDTMSKYRGRNCGGRSCVSAVIHTDSGQSLVSKENRQVWGEVNGLNSQSELSTCHTDSSNLIIR